MNYKKAFYSKLEDCYLGVKIKDFHKGNIAKSGFSNLLKIKERYFAHIKGYLDSQIESKSTTNWENHDIYNKLFTFFDSYLNESGTPFFTDTPIYKNIYAKVYSNAKDTSLFYKTQNLYYVKSDTLYQSLTLSDENESYEVIFDASEYCQSTDNSKNKVVFKLDSILCHFDSTSYDSAFHSATSSCHSEALQEIAEETSDQIIIKVTNQKDLSHELSDVFKQNSNEFSEEFLKTLKENKIKYNEESLKKIFKSYKKQSEIDFFIHKNAKAFLQEQFNLWMFNYLYKDSEIQEWNPHIIAHLQRIKNIAYEVISLIADFENELKAIWLKPKFAKKVEYVFSVDILLKHSVLSEGNSSLTQSLQEFQKTASVISDELAPFQFSSQPTNLTQDTRIATLSTSNHSEQKPQTLMDFIINDKGFESQIAEWQELKLIDETFDKQNFLDFCHSEALQGMIDESNSCHTEVLRSKAEESQQDNKRDISALPQYDKSINCHCEPTLAGEESQNIKSQEVFCFAQYDKVESQKYLYLPIDTKHFSQETKYKILSSFDNLESLLNGELIKSDNFQALNTLKPKYQGKVDLIYIDPPYNTGNDGFIYADTFNHSSWLSLMNNRLECARELLNLKGSIFISIDDKEQARLKLLCDEVFGEENFVSNVIWEKKYSPSNDSKYLSDNHDFIVSYAKNKDLWKPILLPRTEEMNARYSNPDNDSRGDWKAGGFSVKTYSKSYDYPITTPSGKVVYPPSGSCWQTSKENYEKLLQDNRIYFGKNNDSKPQIKQFLSEVQQGVVSKTLWRYDEVGHNQIAKQEIKAMFKDEIFDTPKPEKLLQRILEIASNAATPPQGEGLLPSKIHSPSLAEGARGWVSSAQNASLVLDFFAGSGTTLAVAQKLGRKWLGVEMGEHFYDVIIPRLKKVIAGFQSGISKECNYKGGGAFRYYELESYEEALSHCEYVLHKHISSSPTPSARGGAENKQTSALAKDDNLSNINITYSYSPSLMNGDIPYSPSARDGEEDGYASIKDGECFNTEIKDSINNGIYKGKDYAMAEKIIDYRKSRKLIDKLNKGEIVSLNMHTESRKDFDIFHTLANLMGWKIKRLFLSGGIESCEFDNGEILTLDSLDLAKYPKLKNLIWWE
ncbi:site-specific DNA-methyltransferase [Helicobacter sp. MIT 14-3879]|uniref:site-specific DNA-methyltransferase n=1 Tax=Helicobacter sp. MIT 14-3879 TaxID=2040649 RepID=UPI000E1EC4BD|nr:site-specific DNA-methyltransferase [Helicobacter sp. MIT 14-3879]RDU61385.1 site-specific DNA-methyltransferase [Helicobacter sp. MIT 14-3879]